MKLAKFSMGIGDRFGCQGKAQLAAFVKAKAMGVEITPVWNKSNREHLIVHTQPDSVRVEADEAVKSLEWTGDYRVDADHIGLNTVDRFIPGSDFFTIDVADFTGKAAAEEDRQALVDRCAGYLGQMTIPGIDEPFAVNREAVLAIAGKYLLAVQEAGRIYRHVEQAKGGGNFITEVSIDETDLPQSPMELFFILLAIAGEQIPVQTIAPKFSGRFNKGVDYVGDVALFEKEFNEDLAVLAFAIREFGLPSDLKLSVHSGSDKFSIYEPIRRALQKHGAGLHVKTAGTTWLEELIGLAASGRDGLQIAKEIYGKSLGRFDELCGPYATVIDINPGKLPSVGTVNQWDGSQFADALRHDPSCPGYNLDFRQLLHVGFKVAAEMGPRYLQALKDNEAVIAANVTENLFDRHIQRIFTGI